jgi:MoxR-like ATPase
MTVACTPKRIWETTDDGKEMTYNKRFNPRLTPVPGSARYVYDAAEGEVGSKEIADRDRVVLAVNVALAAGRPLLVKGAPGCGKSTLARDVAEELGRTYYEHVVTSRSEARDLIWQFDAVRRLADAQVRAKDTELPPLQHYVEPKALWWAIDPSSAARRGVIGTERGELADPGHKPVTDRGGAVVLLDEIDKAEPDVPNDLLAPLGARKDEIAFRVLETGYPVKVTRSVLVVLTTNEERDLPDAFMRRCIVLTLRRPGPSQCLQIARSHFSEDRISAPALHALAARYDRLATHAEGRNLRVPGTAEFLDAVSACIELDVRYGSPDWRWVTDRAMWKHDEEPPAQQAAEQ